MDFSLFLSIFEEKNKNLSYKTSSYQNFQQSTHPQYINDLNIQFSLHLKIISSI
jgi:hypothetical protein